MPRISLSLLFFPLVSSLASAVEPLEDYTRLFPDERYASPAELAAMKEREAAPAWTGDQLDYIGMPVSGIGTGQLYIAGDGSLWYWGIFNKGEDDWSKCEGHRYAHPSRPDDFKPIHQEFFVRWNDQYRTLDDEGFSDITFKPRFPVAEVEYRDESLPFEIDLLAFTPFIPNDLNRSSYPVAVMEYTVCNTSNAPQEIKLGGLVENFSADFLRGLVEGKRINEGLSRDDFTAIVLGSEITDSDVTEEANVTVFEDFNGDNFLGWTVEGEAFGSAPQEYEASEKRLNLRGEYDGKMAVSMRPDEAAQGMMLSDPFTITQPFIRVSFAAGRQPHAVGLRLIVDGEVVRTMMGTKARRMWKRTWNVGALIGKEARIQIFDTGSQRNDYVMVDEISFADLPYEKDMPDERSLSRPNDLGELSLAIIGSAETTPNATAALDERPIGGIQKTLQLQPGESETVTILLSWRYPYRGGRTRTYGLRWDSMEAQLAEVVENYETLKADTLLFAETWRDSTLPHWLLDRILIPINALNSNTVLDFNDGKTHRFSHLESSNSLGGNCTHVWHYAQASARLFPEFDYINRQQVELHKRGVRKDGMLYYRITPNSRWENAMDGSTGSIMRILRETQMSEDTALVEEMWPNVKKAMTFLINKHDKNRDGITEDWQHNTLDQNWKGEIPWLSSMYMAGLKATAEMARMVGDDAFAEECEAIIEVGRTKFVEQMWEEDYGYYVMHAAPDAEKVSPGHYDGVHIDMLLGEWWLTQLGLDPILPEDKTREALRNLFRYNFTPDVGPYREVYTGGRWYAMPGEGGLLMITYPFGGGDDVQDRVGTFGYYSENMTGFEWAAAAHMIEMGLLDEGLQVVRAIDERYAPHKRNPFNEIECGDHYGRALSSYATLIALSGYEFDGPAGRLAFAPVMSPENFRAPFTVAKGWGTFDQERISRGQINTLELRFGSLELQTLELDVARDIRSVTVTLDGKTVAASFEQDSNTLTLTFENPVSIEAGQTLTVELR